MTHARSAAPDARPYLDAARALATRFAGDAAERDASWGRPTDQVQALKDAGLLNLVAPHSVGGPGLPFSTVHRIVRILAAADASLAHIYLIHHVSRQFVLASLDDTRQAELWRHTLAGNWLWANAANMAARKLLGERSADGYRLDGEQPFCSGSHVADRLHVAWNDAADGRRLSATVALPHPGITPLDDWNGIGMRHTGSGTVRFAGVGIAGHEVLPDLPDTARAWRLLPIAPGFTNTLLGIAQGALRAARHYTLTHSRPAPQSPDLPFHQEQGVQRIYGDLHARLLAAEALTERVLDTLDTALAGPEPAAAEVRRLSVQATAARNFVTEVALDTTSRLFETMGARSATTAHAFDRYWRDARIISLHDSHDYRVRSVGEWFLGTDGGSAV